MVHEIYIDMDKECFCGNKGICENGYCIKCNAEKLKQKGTGMKEELDKKALEKAKTELCALLDENWDDIVQMRDIAAVNHAKAGNDGKFTFKVACTITQIPKGNCIDIKTGIGCSSPLKDETDFFTVDLQPDLPME